MVYPEGYKHIYMYTFSVYSSVIFIEASFCSCPGCISQTPCPRLDIAFAAIQYKVLK